MNNTLPAFQYINMQLIDEIMEGDDVTLLEIIIEFIHSLESDVVQMQLAFEKKDLIQVGMIAHKFKSMFNYFGVFSVQEQLKELERLSKHKKQVPRIKSLMEEIIDCSYHALVEVRQLLKCLCPDHELNVQPNEI